MRSTLQLAQLQSSYDVRQEADASTEGLLKALRSTHMAQRPVLTLQYQLNTRVQDLSGRPGLLNKTRQTPASRWIMVTHQDGVEAHEAQSKAHTLP
jgi:hypothetical protein